MLTDADLSAIRARLEAATPGPWMHDDYEVFTESKPTTWICVDVDRPENRTFLACAPTDLRALLDEVERLRGEVSLRELRVKELTRVLNDTRKMLESALTPTCAECLKPLQLKAVWDQDGLFACCSKTCLEATMLRLEGD